MGAIEVGIVSGALCFVFGYLVGTVLTIRDTRKASEMSLECAIEEFDRIKKEMGKQ